MANLRDIRNRIEWIKNTQQITKAMKMVAAAKLRKAQDRIIDTRPYASKMQEIVARLAKGASQDNGLMQQADEIENILFIVVSSDRGLCGGFNNNLFKKVEKRIETDYASYKKQGTLSLITIGRKATKHFGKHGYTVVDEFPGFFDEISFGKTAEIIKSVTRQFEEAEYDAVHLAYNEFQSVISQNRLIEQILPIDPATLIEEDSDEEEEFIDYIFEPDAESILQSLLPLHVQMKLWKAILESNAAEQGARMTAMENATENAKEL